MKRLIFVSALLSLAACQTVPAPSTDTAIDPPPAVPPAAEVAVEPETSGPQEAELVDTAEAPEPESAAMLRNRAANLQLAIDGLNADLEEIDQTLDSLADARKELVDAGILSNNGPEAEEIEAAIHEMNREIAGIQLEKRSILAEIDAMSSRADTLIAEADAMDAAEAEALLLAENEAEEAVEDVAAAPEESSPASDEPRVTLVVMEDQIRSDEDASDTAAPATAPRERCTLLDYSDSALIWSLLSDQLRNDDIAIMGIVSGARSYCGLNWQQGFAQFIQIAAQNGWDVNAVADEHGRFMGGARRSLMESGYSCNANDLETLEAIYP